jgi:FPC/CPF motif-containing protein YcgG
MKKYLVTYFYKDIRIFNVFVVPKARDSKHAKSIVATYHPPNQVEAISLDSIKSALWSCR